MQEKTIKEVIINATTYFFKYTLLFLCLMLLVRIFFFLGIHYRLNVEWSYIGITLSGILYDLVLLSKIALAMLVPFYLLFNFSKKAAKVLYVAVMYLYILLYALLTEYFCNVAFPLDSAVFAYPLSETKDIVMASAEFSIVSILLFVLQLLLSIIISIVWNKIEFTSKSSVIVSASFVGLLVITAFCVNNKILIENYNIYTSIEKKYYSTNQLAYSYYKIKDYLKDKDDYKIDNSEWHLAMKQYQSLNHNFEYVDDNYPLIRKKTESDVIGEMLNLTDDGNKPNFVFVIIESLGQKLTGVDSPSVSFTPYIDSLKNEGLYWENCVSSAQRTFGALPSIFASAPYGDIGFASQWASIPRHNSLIKELVDNGYKASFFYSGDASFDGQDAFMKCNGVSYVLDKQPDDKYVNADNLRWKRWGIDDEFMYEMAIDYKKQNSASPFLDIYITISTHEPYIIPNMEKYEKEVEHILATHNFSNPKEKENIRNNKNVYASYLYADDCLRYLIEEYKKIGQYDNTIFLITGDHGNPLNVCTNPLNKYNVPFVISSSLVKHPKKMKGVVSHMDVYPTIDAYLSHNYQYKSKSETHCLGTTFDTSSNFNCNQDIAFMLVNRSITDYLYDTLLLSDNVLYTVGNGLNTKILDNDNMQKEMSRRLELIKKMHHYTVNNNLVWKDNSDNITYMCSYNSNFDDDDDFYNTKNIDGNNCIHQSPESLYSDLYRPIVFDESTSQIITEISFNYKCLNDQIPPKLVITIEKDKKKLYGMQVDIPISKDGEWSKYVFFKEHYIEEDISGATMKLFLWNENKSDFVYDDILLNIGRR